MYTDKNGNVLSKTIIDDIIDYVKKGKFFSDIEKIYNYEIRYEEIQEIAKDNDLNSIQNVRDLIEKEIDDLYNATININKITIQKSVLQKIDTMHTNYKMLSKEYYSYLDDKYTVAAISNLRRLEKENKKLKKKNEELERKQKEILALLG